MPQISADYLRSRVHYNPDTGDFVWLPKDPSLTKNRQWNGQYAGKIAGCICKDGYRILTLDYVYQRGHQLAWLYMTGEWPPSEIDHKDRDRSNNRWSNLRLATTSQNQANTGLQIRNTSGIKGVNWAPRHKAWKARISVNGRRLFLGMFKSKEAAAAAYQEAAKTHFGEFANLK
jgi:hypothetical protein